MRQQSIFNTLAAVVALVLLCVTSSVAQQEISTRIDELVTSEMQARKIPGVSLAVLRDGKIAVLKSYGFANLEHRVPVKPETVFQSGSMGKQFTAAAIMILVQEGKLSLDDKIRKYLPNVPDTWEDITVRHLLSHTSGLGDYPPDIDLQRNYTEDQYLESFTKSPLAFHPGEKWDYSNAGYVTLGILIRKITGQYYGDFLQQRIFRPLGMTTAGTISEADIVPNRAAGYLLVNGETKNQTWVSPTNNSTADGSLYFSILDLAKWDAALYTDHPLKQSTLARVWEPVMLKSGKRKGYGFGWFTDVIHNRRVIFHGGAWQGFKTCIIRFPDDRLTVIVLANSWNAREFKLARGVAGLYFPEFAVPPVQSIEEKEPKVAALVRTFLLQLSRAATIESSLVEPKVLAELTPTRLNELSATLNSLSLPIAIFHSGELVERRDENDLKVYRYLFNDIGKTLALRIKLTKADRIAAFELVEV